MYLSSTFIAGLLLAAADGVLGGSRLWEAKAPNNRTNPSPAYPAIATLNSTSLLVKRAMSIDSNPNDPNSASRIWPNKKIRYCFDHRDEVIRGLWDAAIELWAPLKRHGFSYEEVSDSDCDSQRSSVLRIYYNDQGRLASTLGIPPINEAQNEADPDNAIVGPYTYLSDFQGIGQDDVNANVAHELGHVWGLGHEHQNPNWWKISSQDLMSGWSIFSSGNSEEHFQTSGFNCHNLKDYNDAHAKLQAKIDAETDTKKKADLQLEFDRLCISPVVAGKYGFSASEWLPLANTMNMVLDSNFDTDSLMMYPSGAGGTGLSNARATVMTFADGSAIPNRLAPSGQDVDRLISLYGTPASSQTGEPYGSKSSKWRNQLKKIRSMNFRAGDTRAGLC